MPVKTGRYSLDDDLRRIRVAQDLAGKGRLVMIDANQAMNRNEALRRGRAYQDMGVFWYEKPLPPHDMEGYAMLADKLEVRIATGENLYTEYEFADVIARKGATWCSRTSASHGGGKANMNMLLTMPNAIYMETSGPQAGMKDGTAPAPEAPGMSTEVDPQNIRKYKIG